MLLKSTGLSQSVCDAVKDVKSSDASKRGSDVARVGNMVCCAVETGRVRIREDRRGHACFLVGANLSRTRISHGAWAGWWRFSFFVCVFVPRRRIDLQSRLELGLVCAAELRQEPKSVSAKESLSR